MKVGLEMLTIILIRTPVKCHDNGQWVRRLRGGGGWGCGYGGND